MKGFPLELGIGARGSKKKLYFLGILYSILSYVEITEQINDNNKNNKINKNRATRLEVSQGQQTWYHSMLGIFSY